jgi:hypothetical protein
MCLGVYGCNKEKKRKREKEGRLGRFIGFKVWRL